MLGVLKLRKRNDIFFLYFYADCLALWIVVQVCFSCVKDSGILRDKMKYKGNQNCGTKSSTKNRFGSVSKHYTDITWKDRGKSGDTSELCNCK